MGLLLGLPSLASGSDLRPTQKDLIEVPQPKFYDLIIYRSYVFNLETTSDQSSFVLPSSVQSFMIPNQPPSPSSFSSSPSDQPPSDQPPMTSDQPSPSPSQSLVSQARIVNVVPVINLIFTAIGLFIAIFAFSIMAFMNIYTRIDNTNTRIDNLGNKIDNGNQEIRNLINSSIRDFNNRIDNVNGRIDNMHKAPSIEN